MNETTGQDQALRTTARILIWCFVFSMALLTLWFGFVALGGGLVYRLHGLFFDISEQHFALTHYLGMALMKISAFVFFLFPYIAIRIVLRDRGKSEGA